MRGARTKESEIPCYFRMLKEILLIGSLNHEYDKIMHVRD